MIRDFFMRLFLLLVFAMLIGACVTGGQMLLILWTSAVVEETIQRCPEPSSYHA